MISLKFEDFVMCRNVDFIVDAVLCSRDESFPWLDLGIGLGKAL